MIEIKPTTLGILGIATNVAITILPFATNATQCSIHWALKTADANQIAEGNHTLTKAEFEAWGDDNAHVENIVLTHLNLERK